MVNNMSLIEPFEKVKSVAIDFPFVQDGDLRSDGNLATSFYTIKIMIDRAIQLGFNTVSFETNVPINVQTGELQLFVYGVGNGDKSFPEAIWEGIIYAESKGLKTVIDLCIRNVLNDANVSTTNVGTGFNESGFFDAVKKYEMEIAKKANDYGVDSIRLGKFNFGFDSEKYSNEWIDIVNSIRKVYAGSLRYLSNVEGAENSIWNAVDEVQIDLSTVFSLKSNYSKEDIIPLYFETYMMGNGFQSSESTYTNIKNIIANYPNKKISIEAGFQPGQSAGYENANPWSFVFEENPLLENAKDQSALIPYPEERIDTRLNQQKIAGFLEFLGNYLIEDISGIQFWQYMPWTESNWIRDPTRQPEQVWQSVVRAQSALNWQPESEEMISYYFLRNWGFKTLHYGTDGNDNLIGSDINDVFWYSPGRDSMDGREGVDTLLIREISSKFILSSEESSWIISSVTPVTQNLNQAFLTDIERLKFSDINIAIDIDGTAGKAYRIYEAVLGRTPDLEGLGYWINDMDNGVSLTTIASGFIASKEFEDKYGTNPSYETYINLLYQNILGRAPDAEGLNYWVSNMQKGIDSPAAVLASFSEGFENTANVAPDIANGIYFTPWLK